MRSMLFLLVFVRSCFCENCSYFTGNYTCACGTCPYSSTEPVQCPFGMSTVSTGASSLSDCVCSAGTYGNFSVGCVQCPANFYCGANASVPTACPSSIGISPLQFQTSQPGSSEFANCSCPSFALMQNRACVRCPPGWFILNAQCVGCRSGYFCPGDGSAYACVDTSECPAKTAGVGLACSNNSFFEPRLQLAVDTRGPAQALALHGACTGRPGRLCGRAPL